MLITNSRRYLASFGPNRSRTASASCWGWSNLSHPKNVVTASLRAAPWYRPASGPTAISVRRANLAGTRVRKRGVEPRGLRPIAGQVASHLDLRAVEGLPSDGADALRFWDGLRELRRQRREAVADGRNAGRCDGAAVSASAKIQLRPCMDHSGDRSIASCRTRHC